MHGILMNVIAPREIRFLESQFRVTEVEPDLAAFRPVEPVQATRGVGVEVREEPAEVGRVGKTARDEVIVIGEYSPGFKLPVILVRQRHKPVLEQIKPGFVSEQPLLVKGAGSDEIHCVVVELVNRRVRPGHNGV